MQNGRPKCLICERRPRLPDSRYCAVCRDKVKADERRKRNNKPEKYLVYRGHVVGLFRNNGRLTPQLLQRSAEGLPKARTINLDKYINGFTREQVKEFKRVVLQLANHRVERAR